MPKKKPGFLACPRGHSIPHKTDNGRCTPVACADDTPEDNPLFRDVAEETEAPKAKAPKKKATHEDLPSNEDDREEKRLARAASREKARRELLVVPEGLKGADAEAWTTQKLVELAPLAAAEMEYRMRFGDDEQRYTAAKDVLQATGHGKKETGGGTGPVLVINMSGGKFNLPWREPERLVEGTATVEKVLPIGAVEQREEVPR